jgi:hypothetical protein
VICLNFRSSALFWFCVVLFYIRLIFAGLRRASYSFGSFTTMSVIGNGLWDVTECQRVFQE